LRSTTPSASLPVKPQSAIIDLLRLGGDQQRAAIAERLSVTVERKPGEPHVFHSLEIHDRAAVAIVQDRPPRHARDLRA
jgi:hypothetical protein